LFSVNSYSLPAWLPAFFHFVSICRTQEAIATWQQEINPSSAAFPLFKNRPPADRADWDFRFLWTLGVSGQGGSQQDQYF